MVNVPGILELDFENIITGKFEGMILYVRMLCGLSVPFNPLYFLFGMLGFFHMHFIPSVGHGPAQVGSAKDDLKAGWAKIKKTSLWQPSE